MKNQANTYGYYLTEDSDTIEFRGDFEQNVLFLPTKNPDAQLNYKVFVSPKKAINFGIQIVGGTNPNVVYIPQHIYKDLQVAYNENNPYYTIKDITIIKLDFTDTGSSIIEYLKDKFELAAAGDLSKIANAGTTAIVNYAGFDESGNPVDEDILKQILYLYEEQNDIIFVDKDDELVTDAIVKNRGYRSNRILGDFTYISNYFDKSGKFNANLLNSRDSIKIETATINSILQLNDFIKGTSNKTLQDVNSIYKNNITVEEKIINAPKILGLVMRGLSKVAPLFSSVRDKVSQLKAQKAQKKLEEARALGGSIRGQATDAVDNVKGLFSTSNALFSQYKTSVSLKAEGGLSNQFTIPSANGLSNKFAIPSFGASNPFNIPGTSGESNPFNIPGTSGESNPFTVPSLGTSNRFNIPGASGTSNPFRLGGNNTSNPFNIPGATGTSNPFRIGGSGTSNPFNIPSLGTSNSFNIPSIGTSNSFNIPGTSGVSNPFRLGGSGTSNPFNIPGTSGESNPFSIGGSGTSNPFKIGGTSGTSNPFRIGSSATSNPFRIGGSAESLKVANSDFLKF